MSKRILLLAACAAATSGCGVLAPLPDSSSADPPGGAPVAATSPEASPAAGAEATKSLVAVGRSARQSGDYEGATAYFEQALRIAPNDPRLWIELGETKLAEGDPAQAEAMGRKALTLTGDDAALEARARRLIAAD